MLDRLGAAASIVARHAGAYGELILSDLEAARAMALRRLMAATVLFGAVMLAVCIGSFWLIAATWNTLARPWVVGALLALFIAVAVWAYWQLALMSTIESGVLPRTAREWAKDRTLIEELIGEQREVSSQ